MSKYRYVLSLFFLSPLLALPARAEIKFSNFKSLQGEVIHGQTLTTIEINKIAKESFEIKITSNQHEPRTTRINKKNFKYILKNFEALPIPEKIPLDCARARVDIKLTLESGKDIEKKSCFGLTTVTEKKYSNFLELLMLATSRVEIKDK